MFKETPIFFFFPKIFSMLRSALNFFSLIFCYLFIPNRTWLATHFELQRVTLHDHLVRNVALRIGLAIYLYRLDVNIIPAYVLRLYGEGLPIVQVHFHFGEERRADFIPSTHRVDRIEAHCAEDIP